MPEASFERSISVWCHSAFKNPPITYPNSSMEILRKIQEGPKRGTELYRPIKLKNGIFGNPLAKFKQGPISWAIIRLENAGLLEKEVVQKRAPAGQGSTLNVRITPLGERLLREHDENQSLPEWGRKLLVDEKEA